jgi:hypothetical protein
VSTPEPACSTTPGEVAAERDWKLVLDHLLQAAGCNEDVDRVDRRRLNPHEQLIIADGGLCNVVS